MDRASVFFLSGAFCAVLTAGFATGLLTAALAGAAIGGSITPLLPVLIPLAFGQYVVDSYVWFRQKQLRASVLGRWNGIMYFVPVVLITAARLPFPSGFASLLRLAARVLGYLLVASTVASMITSRLRASDIAWRSRTSEVCGLAGSNPRKVTCGVGAL